jgi:polyisoprenoid-binding protein YceI
LTTPGVYKNINISGTMTLHGVSRPMTVPADFEVGQDNEIKGYATFKIRPEEYNIEIPKLVSEKIAKEIAVTVDALYKLSK